MNIVNTEYHRLTIENLWSCPEQHNSSHQCSGQACPSDLSSSHYSFEYKEGRPLIVNL